MLQEQTKHEARNYHRTQMKRELITTGRLIQIARDGKISDDEMRDFAFISKKLDEISLAIDSLNLWVNKTASEQDLNLELLNAEKEKLK